jgi:hypothetical protein
MARTVSSLAAYSSANIHPKHILTLPDSGCTPVKPIMSLALTTAMTYHSCQREFCTSASTVKARG